MAIITLAAPVSGIRGKVAGVIYSANKAGPYLKGWSRGSNPRTFNQSAHRSVIISFAIAWRSITPTQRADWDTYAGLAPQEKFNSLGESYFASGFNWFIEINSNLSSAGLPVRNDAPTIAIPDVPTLDTLTVLPSSDSASSLWKLEISDPDIGEYHTIKAHILNSVGRLSFSPVKPFMVTIIGGAGGQDIYFQTELEAYFGTIQLGQKAFVTCQTQNAHGVRSALNSASVNILEGLPTEIFNDTFTETSDTLISAHIPELGTGWTVVLDQGGADFQVNASLDVADYSLSEPDAGAFATADSFYPSPDYYIEAVIKEVAVGDNTTSLMLRYLDNDNMYYVTWSDSNLLECRIFKKVAGTTTIIASLSQVLAPGSTVIFSIVGTSLEVYDDGLLVGSATDSSLTLTGKAGFGFGKAFDYGSNDLAGQELDSFSVTEI